eukprot:jgi/Bigna1/84429/fgenesh1_pg.136_\
MTLPDRCRSGSTNTKVGRSNSQSLSLPAINDTKECIELQLFPEFRSFFPHVRRNPQRAARCNNKTLLRDCFVSEDDEEDGDNDTNTADEGSPTSSSTDDDKLIMELEDDPCIAAEAFIGSLLDAFEESSMLADSSGITDTDNDREAHTTELRSPEDNGSVASRTSSTSDKSWHETEKIATASTVKKKRKKNRATVAPENPINPTFPEVPDLQNMPHPPPNTPRACTSKIPKYLQHRRRKLPRKAREILSAWFESNIADPYPSDDEREELMRTTGLTSKQIHHWFTNRRKRDVKWRAKWEISNVTIPSNYFNACIKRYLFRGRGRRPKNAGKLARAMAAAMAAQENVKHNDHQVRQQQTSFANISKGFGSCNTSRRRSAAAVALQNTAFKEEQGGRGQDFAAAARLLKRRRSCDNAVVLSLSNFFPKPEKSF